MRVGRFWMLGLVLLALTWGAAAASDGGTRVLVGDEPVGPYRLYFLTAPEPSHTGTTASYIARLSDGATGEKIRNLAATVALTHVATGRVLTQPATHLSDDAIDYVAYITFDADGEWQGVLRIDGPAGPIESRWTQEVQPARSTFTLAALGLPFLALLLALGAVWVIRTRRRAAAAP